MISIKNLNDKFGSPEVFTGDTLDLAIEEMQSTIRMCGEDFKDVVVTDEDYEIVSRCEEVPE